MAADTELPDLGAVLAKLFARVPAAQHPLLIALAERLAAERYRGWAREIDGAERQAALRACAEREEEIARRVEALHPDAADTERALREALPELPELNRALFAPLPLVRQLRLQARGERLGAATWRAFATATEDRAARAVFDDCARLEEESAAVLEAYLDDVEE